MLIRKRISIVAALMFAALAVSCSDSNNEPTKHESEEPNDESRLDIVAAIDSYTQGIKKSTFEKGDRLGVFIYENNTSKILKPNAEYGNTGFYAHKFLPLSKKDRPDLARGTKVGIAAYYPYSPDATADGKININIRNQADGRDYDLMTGIAVGKSGSEAVQVNFVHRLSIISVRVTGVSESDKSLKATITGAQAEGQFDLLKESFESKAGDIEVLAQKASTQKQITAYIIPSDKNQEIRIKMQINGIDKVIKIESQRFEEGKKYEFNFNISNDGNPIPSDYSNCLEMPVVPTNANYTLINHYEPYTKGGSPISGATVYENKNIRNYSYLYDKNKHIACWVAYPLHGYYLGSVRRPKPDPWHYDMTLGEKWQDNVSRGYRSNGMRCDRGHQIPSADRTKDEVYNYTTFIYANCTAQSSDLNEIVWQELEMRVRGFQGSLKGIGLDTLYVVTGAGTNVYPGMEKVNRPTVRDANGKTVTVPYYYYKALAIRKADGGYETMAFILPNKPGIPRNAYNDYRISVKKLEECTGFKFFPNIPEGYKNSDRISGWK